MKPTERLEALQELLKAKMEGRQIGNRNDRVREELPLFTDFIGKHPELQKELCSCSRPFSFAKLHCPSCGRAPLYPMRTIPSVLPSGIEVLATKFRCRGCPRVYTDVDCYYHCEAPAPQKSAAQRKAEAAVEKFTGGSTANELVKQLAEFRRSQGKPLGIVEDALKRVEEEEKANAAKPGTPEWYAEHPEET